MKKLYTIIMIVLFITTLVGCTNSKNVDVTPPVIYADNVIIVQNSTFDPMADVTVNDNVSTNISLSITNSNVDVTQEGVYTVTYYAKDEAGNEFYKTISVTVTSLEDHLFSSLQTNSSFICTTTYCRSFNYYENHSSFYDESYYTKAEITYNKINNTFELVIGNAWDEDNSVLEIWTINLSTGLLTEYVSSYWTTVYITNRQHDEYTFTYSLIDGSTTCDFESTMFTEPVGFDCSYNFYTEAYIEMFEELLNLYDLSISDFY